MARRKMGTILWSDDGTSCRVQVTRGRRSDGSRRRVTRTLYGVSADEAEAEAVRMAAELGASDLAGDSMTLSDFYWGLFRDTPSNRGTPRTKTTLRGYDQAMRRYVLPTLGDVRLDRITHDMQARVVIAAQLIGHGPQLRGDLLQVARGDFLSRQTSSGAGPSSSPGGAPTCAGEG